MSLPDLSSLGGDTAVDREDGVLLPQSSIFHKDDIRSVLAAVKLNGLQLQFASDQLKSKREVVLVAVENNGWALQYAAVEFRKDFTVVLAAVRQKGTALKYSIFGSEWNIQQNIEPRSSLVATRPLGEKQVVLAAVRQDGYALEYAALHNDCQLVVFEAVKSNVNDVGRDPERRGAALMFADARLQRDKDFVLAAVSVEKNGFLLRYAADTLRFDPKFVSLAVKKNGMAIRIVHRNMALFEYEKHLLNAGPIDGELVRSAVEQNGLALQFLTEEERGNPEIVYKAVKQNGDALAFASSDFQVYKKLRMLAAKTSAEFAKLVLTDMLIDISLDTLDFSANDNKADEAMRSTISESIKLGDDSLFDKCLKSAEMGTDDLMDAYAKVVQKLFDDHHTKNPRVGVLAKVILDKILSPANGGEKRFLDSVGDLKLVMDESCTNKQQRKQQRTKALLDAPLHVRLGLDTHVHWLGH